MKKKKYQVLAFLLASVLSSSLSGCRSEGATIETVVNDPIVLNENNAYTSEEIESIMASVEENIPKEEEKTYETGFSNTIIATEKVGINSLDGNLLGYLKKDGEIEYIEVNDDGNYLVNYYGEYAYIDKNFVIESTKANITGEIKQMFYTTVPTTLTIPDYLSGTGTTEEVNIDALECFEVYEETEDYYLVSTIDFVGYIKKDDLVELIGTFVVVDLSNQELRLYEDNQVILRTPVITGKPSSPSDAGAFTVFEETYSRYLVGPGYRSYVDVMMKYNGGEGLHDAEYHTCNKSHGWKNYSDFGGDTYLTNGSHGCVNMPHEDAIFTSEYIDVGSLVLVKP